MWNTNDLELVKLNFRATYLFRKALKSLENIFNMFKYLSCP